MVVVLLTLVTILEAVELEEVDKIDCFVNVYAWLTLGLAVGSDDNCGDDVTIGFLCACGLQNARQLLA